MGRRFPRSRKQAGCAVPQIQACDGQRAASRTLPLRQGAGRRDPSSSTNVQLAERAKFKSRIHFERALGYAPWSAPVKRCKHYPAKYAEHIDVNTASVIVRELGIAPREVPAL
jgi:hypothetical protein